MNREYHRWYSPTLNREMQLLVFGHAGLPVVIFPTSRGSFFEWEDRGMLGATAGQLENGSLRLYCVDSIDSETWYNDWVHPRQRVDRYKAYEWYILSEVAPLIHLQGGDYPDPRFGVMGASLGAFHAGEMAFRHPQAVSKLVALSGKFDNSSFVHGYSDIETYLTNPLAFLPGLNDPDQLNALRAMQIAIVSGDADPNINEARQVSRILWEKGVPNDLDVWGGWSHDWPYWFQMVRNHF